MQALSRQVMALLEFSEFRRVWRCAGACQTFKRAPICAWCNRIRDDKGYWDEGNLTCIKTRAVDFSHGICPDCLNKVRPDERHRMVGS